MPEPVAPNPLAAPIELGLLAIGLFLLWRHVLRPSARVRIRATLSPLPAWAIPLSEFFLFLLVVAMGGFLGSALAGFFLGASPAADTRAVLVSAGFQLGLLAGVAAYHCGVARRPLRFAVTRADLTAGGITFLIALPLVTGATFASVYLLKACGLPAEKQELVDLFLHAKSPVVVIALIALATLVAPVAEELLFRAGFFRYLRTRIPHWAALLLPGALFGFLHVNWVNLDGLASLLPLVVLAVIFSLAYERTGRIGTAIVAHALFNLHTVVLIFAGVTN